jgi:hypothetical protein
MVKYHSLSNELKLQICPGISIKELGLHLAISREGTDEKAVVNPTAAAVIALSDGTRTIDEVIQKTIAIFQSTDEQASAQLRLVIDQLCRNKILELSTQHDSESAE